MLLLIKTSAEVQASQLVHSQLIVVGDPCLHEACLGSVFKLTFNSDL